MKIVRILLGTLLLVTTAEAGTITLNFGAAQTITTTAAQDNRLARVLAFVNSTRAPGDQFATVELWLRNVLQETVQSYVQQANERNAEDACAAYKALTAAQQSAIDSQLGNKSPCR